MTKHAQRFPKLLFVYFEFWTMDSAHRLRASEFYTPLLNPLDSGFGILKFVGMLGIGSETF
jgi:hypothetical protein